MTIEPNEQQLFERSVIALEKLNLETARLRTDVNKLLARVEPFEGETFTSYSPHELPKQKTFRDVLDSFETVRKSLIQSQQTVGLIEARINQIHNDSWSRADIKPWIKGGDK